MNHHNWLSPVRIHSRSKGWSSFPWNNGYTFTLKRQSGKEASEYVKYFIDSIDRITEIIHEAGHWSDWLKCRYFFLPFKLVVWLTLYYHILSEFEGLSSMYYKEWVLPLLEFLLVWKFWINKRQGLLMSMYWFNNWKGNLLGKNNK